MSDVSMGKIPSHSVAFFSVQLFSLMRLHLSIVGLNAWANGILFRNIILHLCIVGDCLYLHPAVCYFRFYIEVFAPIELVLCWMIDKSLIPFLYLLGTQFFQYRVLKMLFSSVYVWHILSNMWWLQLRVFMFRCSTLFQSTRLFLFQYHAVFYYFSSQYSLKPRTVIPPALLFLINVTLAVWRLLVLYEFFG